MNTLLNTRAARRGPGQNSPWAYRHLILNFARRDLKARFKGTVLGWLWALAVPITTVIIYTVVFGLVFRATPPPMGNGDTGHYAVWLLVAIVPWAFFLNSVNTGPVALLGNGPLLQKVYIPAFVPPFASTVAVMVQSAIELGVVIVVLMMFANVSWTYLLLPFLIVLFVVFTGCVATALAILNVYARDLSQLVAVVLQLLFFVTPILYPEDLIPQEWNGIPVAAIFDANPLAAYIGAFRDLVYGLTVPSPAVWLYMLAWAAAAVGALFVVYRRWGLDVSESI